MPIQFCDLDTVGYWGGGGDLDSSSFINELEFYSTTSPSTNSSSSTSSSNDLNTSASSVMGATSAALVPVSDSWCKIENMDEESYLSMSPPDPFKFPDWDEYYGDGDESGGDKFSLSRDNFEGGLELILIHDCMWAGGCSACDHEVRTLSRQSSTSSSSSGNSDCGSSSSSSNNVNSNSKGSNNHSRSSNNNEMNENNSRTGPSNLLINNQSQNNSSSSTNSNINNSSSNNNNNCSSSSNANNFSCSTANNSSGVVQTIEVPSVCGPVRRTGVIVQKTFGVSLLIKSKTNNKCENPTNNSSHNNNVSSCNTNNNNTNNNNSNVSNSKTSIKVKTVNEINDVNRTVSNSIVNSIPTPPISNSRPETPQSLSESEDDTLDFSSVFFNIDNLKPPQGDLWDEVLAAVEQEQANGIEIPPLSCNNSSNVNDTNNNKISCSASDATDDLLNSTKINSSGSPTKTIGGSSPSRTALPNAIAAATTVVSDHSYDKRAWIRLEDLGVQTPSDSEEEEIDVVSLIERSRSTSRSSSTSSHSGSIGLPTNPSAKDQEEIQVITTSKLLNAASRAVSRRLRSKITNRSKAHHPCNKRRLSDFDEHKTSTKLSKKPRVYYKGKSRFATDSESDSKEKRDMHNNMERMRRIDLRNSFEELKALVPSLVVKERAPKVQILQEAASYCSELKFESRKLATQVAALRKEQERLRGTVSGLRRSLAAHR